MSGAGTNLKEFPLPTFKFVPADQRHSLCVGNFFVLPSGADSMARAPHFYKWLGTGGTMSRRTANKKLTKALTKTTNCAFRAKKWRGTTKNIFSPVLCVRSMPPPLLLQTGAPPLSNSFQRNWSYASTFWALQVQLVVLVTAFMMGSTDLSVYCLLFFYSQCPRLCSAICKSVHLPRALCSWSHWL